VKQKRLPKTYKVKCLVVSAEMARTVSLTENTQRETMHPADQFDARILASLPSLCGDA
jgi:ParB family transcriptional regulator, chromosome partitioning protein